MATDYEQFQSALRGEIPIEEAIEQIESSNGFPIDSGDGHFVFVFLAHDGPWRLVGDHEDWSSGCTMHAEGHWWWTKIHIPRPTNSRYKFRKADHWLADPLARRYNYDENGEISYVRCTEKHLERWDSIMSDRRIRVWVPTDGIFDRTLYIHDGQNIYDPESAWGGWRLQDSLPNGILCVAIDNNAERLNEYTHTSDKINGVEIGGDADQYLDRIEQELRPTIERTYGTSKIIGVMGASLGGLLAFYTIHRYPKVYAMAISLSGTMGWGSFSLNNNTMLELFTSSGRTDHFLYLDSGGYGTLIDSDGDNSQDDGHSVDNYSVNIQFRDALVEIGYVQDVNLWYWYQPYAPHNEAAWAQRVWRSLEHFGRLKTTRVQN